MNPTELRAKRARVWGQMCAIVDGARDAGRDLEAEEARQYDELEVELNGLSDSLERAERHADVEARLTEVRETTVVGTTATGERVEADGEELGAAFREFLVRGINEMSPERRELMRARFVASDELRAQGIGTNVAGGYTVPAEFWNRLAETQVAYGGMLAVANVIDTDTGADLPWPTNDDTANEGTILAENTQVTEQDVTFGQRTLGAFVYTSRLVRVSYQFLQDSSLNAEAFLNRKFAERLGRIHNRHFTNGTGTGQPAGIVTGVTTGKTGAGGQTTTVTYDDLIDLEHSIDPAVRAGGRTRYMFNDTTLASLRKIKDADGRPMWQPSIQAGVPDLINGKPYTINQHMPAMAAGAKSILFGDFFDGYVIRRVKGMQVLRLNERYADFLQVGFLAFDRVDGGPDNPAAVKAYVNAAV